MNIYSIRVKMLLPLVSLALVLIGIFVLLAYSERAQKHAVKEQIDSYFEAISVVLNADRDIYQARLAQEMSLSGHGTALENKKVFDENAQQVKDRFALFRGFLVDQPQLLTQFESFDQLHQSWLNSTQQLFVAPQTPVLLSDEFKNMNSEFSNIRKILDDAGDKLRQHLSNIEVTNSSIKDLERYVEAITQVLNADRDFYQARLALQKLVNNNGDVANNKIDFHENAKQVLQRFNAFRSLISDLPALIKPYEKFDILFNQWYQHCENFIASYAPNSQSQQGGSSTDQAFKSVRSLLDTSGEVVRQHARDSEKIMEKNLVESRNLSIIVIAFVFIAALAFGLFVTTAIAKDVEALTRRIKEIAEGDGDLTLRINSHAKDELGALANQFDSFVEQLRAIIGSVQAQSNDLGGMTTSLRDVSAQAKSITNALADASDQIVDAANEMSVSNKQMAESAIVTAQEANKSGDQTQQGIDAVKSSNSQIVNLASGIEETLVRSEELEKSSAAISSVLEVIRKIADQTNLLALNAAIEAARAGEQGRGFAVVADEVRMLATKTQDSTNEIEAMIDELKGNVQASSSSIMASRNHVDTTTQNFQGVVSIFDALTASFEGVKEMAEQTSQATQEQSSVSGSLIQNLQGMKEQTDIIEGISETIDSHSNKILELYQRLSANVGSFKV